MCQTYYELWTLEFSIGGDVSECAVLNGILAAANNVSFEESIRLMLTQLYNTIKADFEQESDVYTRLEILMNCTYTWYTQVPFDLSYAYAITFEYTFDGITTECSFYEMLFLAFFYSEFGFDCTLPLNPTTTAAITTEASTQASTSASSPCSQANEDSCFTNVPKYNNTCPVSWAIMQTWSGLSTSDACREPLNSASLRVNTYVSEGGGSSAIAQKCWSYFSTLASCTSEIMESVIIFETGFKWGPICELATECYDQTSSALQCS